MVSLSIWPNLKFYSAVPAVNCDGLEFNQKSFQLRWISKTISAQVIDTLKLCLILYLDIEEELDPSVAIPLHELSDDAPLNDRWGSMECLAGWPITEEKERLMQKYDEQYNQKYK